MATTLSASRIIDGDPAVALLLITGPSGTEFLPQTTLNETKPGKISGVLRLDDGTERAMHVFTSAPRRTPIAYISDFRVVIDGMPPTAGSLHVTSAGPEQSNVIFTLRAEGEIPPEFENIFGTVADGFFDGLVRAAREHTSAA
jgi:hypothetical protein